MILSRGWYPTQVFLAVGLFLFLSRSLYAAIGEVAIAAILLLEGIVLITDFRGYASAAVRDYKRDPDDYWAKATPWWMMRIVWGGVLVFAAAMYLWTAVQTIS